MEDALKSFDQLEYFYREAREVRQDS
jgi:hypothetical protein